MPQNGTVRADMCDECRRLLAQAGCLDLWHIAVAAAEFRMAAMIAHPSCEGGDGHER